MIRAGMSPAQHDNEHKKMLLIFGGVGVLALLIFLSWLSHREPKPDHANYSRDICDSTADQNYEDLNPPYIQIQLQEGCFSGWMTFPDNWSIWEGQFMQHQPGAWVAQWYEGQTDPIGPYDRDQLAKVRIPVVPARRIRLEGSGMFRFYRHGMYHPQADTAAISPEHPASKAKHTEQAAAPQPGPDGKMPSVITPATTVTPDDAPTPELPRTPVQPYSGAANDLDMTIEQCVFEAGKVNCWGFAKSSAETPLWAGTNDDSTATDDLGNTHRLSQMYNQFHFSNGPSQKLLPGVPVRFSLVANGISPQSTKLSALDLSLSWRSGTMGGFGSQTFHYLYKNIPIQKKTPSGDGG
jgi:hypothetical protein